MRLFPQNVVRRMHYTAERVSAQEACRLGAVVRVVPPERLMEEAMKDAAIIAAKMPLGIKLAKEGLNQIEWMDLKSGYRFEQTRTGILQKSEDATEAKRAFLEKRPPVFKGR
jgi:enoyl-CoA hydratase/carnithine racemase